jgi:hypothetical protein
MRLRNNLAGRHRYRENYSFTERQFRKFSEPVGEDIMTSLNVACAKVDAPEEQPAPARPRSAGVRPQILAVHPAADS